MPDYKGPGSVMVGSWRARMGPVVTGIGSTRVDLDQLDQG